LYQKFAFSKSLKYKYLPEITPKTISYENSRKHILKLSKNCENRNKISSLASFHQTGISSVSSELQHLFLTSGAVRNDFFSEDI